MNQRPRRVTAGYIAILVVTFLISVTAGWIPMAARVDRDAYDWMFQLHPPVISSVSSVVLAIDERTLTSLGGMRNLRRTLADGLSIVNTGHPAAVAIDLTLSD